MSQSFLSGKQKWIGYLDHCRAYSPHTGRSIGKLALFSFLFIVLALFFYFFYPHNGPDFPIFSSVNWVKPYADPLYANPPWLFLVIPWVFLPVKIGSAINRAVMILIFLYQLKQWHNDSKISKLLFSYFLLFTSPGFLYLFVFNNIDYIILCGLMLPIRDGLLVVMLKPQVAFAGVIVWVNNNRGNIHKLINILLPSTIILLSTILIWGLWPLDMIANAASISTKNHNISFWPWSIPIGLWLLVKAIKDDDFLLAAAVSPLLFPYINITSLSVTMTILLIRKDYVSAGWLYGASWYFMYLLFNA